MNGSVRPLLAVPALCLLLRSLALATTTAISPCDLNSDGKVSVADVQAEINQAAGLNPAANDLNYDAVVNVVDVQIVIDGVFGFSCVIPNPNAGPHTSTSKSFSVYNRQPALSNPQTTGPLAATTASFSIYNQLPALTNPQPTGPLVATATSFSVYNRQPALSNPQPNSPPLLSAITFSIYNSLSAIPSPAGYPPFAQSLTYSVGNGPTGTLSPAVLDTDRDGLPDFVEMAIRGDRWSTDPDGDEDRDGLTNLEEYCLGTDPQKADTDGDGVPDGEEVLRGTNPRLADSDGDGYTDWEEIQAGTDPLDANSHPAYPPLAKPAAMLMPRFFRPANWPACDAALAALDKRMNAMRAARGMKPGETPVLKQQEEKQ